MPLSHDAELERTLAEVVRNHPGVRLAAVFGSAARGQLRSGSDVDVAILLDDLPQSERNEIEAALGRAAGRTLDFVDLAYAPPLLRFEVARDGVLLYEREPHLWVDFKARAMIDWWDWAPTARMIHEAIAERLRAKVAAGPR